MAFNVKLGVLRALLRLRVPPDLSRVLNEALTLVRGGFDDRNTVAHAYIGRGRHPGELYVQETKLAGGVLPEPAYWHLDRLWKAAHALSEGCDLVDRTLDRHGVPKFEPRLPATLGPTPHQRL